MSLKTRNLLICIAAIALSALSCAAQSAPPIVLKNVNIVDPVSGKVQEHMSLEIRGGKIWEIGPDLQPKAGEKLVDGNGAFAMPGLIDTRVQLGVSPANHVLRAEIGEEQRITWLHTMLKLGVTSARLIQGDLGEQKLFKYFRVQDLLNAPSLFISGPTFTAPDGTPADQYPRLAESMRSREVSEVANNDDARDKSRQVAHSGGDVFEVSYTAGQKFAPVPRLNDDAFATIVKEAHGHDLKVFCWVGHNDEALKAIATGCDALEGGSEDILSDEVLKQMAAKNIPFMSSILSQGYLLEHVLPADAMKAYLEQPLVSANLSPVMHKSLDGSFGHLFAMRKLMALPIGTTTEERRQALNHDPNAKPQSDASKIEKTTTVTEMFAEQERRAVENVKRAKAAGVKVFIGTGAGSPLDFPGISEHLEMQRLIEVGFTNVEALQAATTNAAYALGKQAEIGAIEKGKNADMVLVEANPLLDIRNAEKVQKIVRDGRVIDPAEVDVY